VIVKFLYRPVGAALGILAGLLASSLFRRLWRTVGEEEGVPTATDRHRGWKEVVAAGAVEGALYGAVKAFVDRAGATGFARATGTWPGRD